MKHFFERLADFVAPSAWVTWLTIHALQVHSVLQDIAFLAATFASVGAGLYHVTKWYRLISNREKTPEG